MLKKLYDLPVLEFRDTFLKHIRTEKAMRKLTHKLMSGYREKEPEEGEVEAEP